MPRRSALAAAALLAALAASPDASAYCRSSVCKVGSDTVQGKVCDPPEEDDCGVVLQWKQPCIGFAVHEAASKQVELEAAQQLMRDAFAAWMSVDCGTGAPDIAIEEHGVIACGRIEYNQHGGNANVLIFHDDAWPHPIEGVASSADTLALTTVTYDVDKGDIFDADIEVNAVNNVFTMSDDNVNIDLLSVLTHEAGHFLGLAHSVAPEATMDPVYPGGINLRSPAADDIIGICKAYPPGRTTEGECTGLPRHGFSPECLEEQTEGTCAVRAGERGGGAGALSLTLALAALAALRKRRAR